jgi:hypothetical protein
MSVLIKRQDIDRSMLYFLLLPYQLRQENIKNECHWSIVKGEKLFGNKKPVFNTVNLTSTGTENKDP